MSTNKYHYIILGDNGDLFKYSFMDLIKTGEATYISSDRILKLTKKGVLKKIIFSARLNRMFNMPFKKRWNNRLLEDINDTEKPLCFIIFGLWFQFINDIDLLEYLRQRYPNSKSVWFAQDLFSTIHFYYDNHPVDVKNLLGRFDFVITYDKGDSFKYSVPYHPTVLSKLDLKDSLDIPSCDVFFIGKSKGRLKLLYDIYLLLSQKGLDCQFIVIDVPIEEQALYPGIKFINKRFTYIENLLYVQKSKCLLELMQQDAEGYTFRTNEAVIYNKYLITNNLSIKHAPFYNEKNIICIDGSTDLKYMDFSFINRKIPYYENYELLLPKNLITFIEDNI